MQNTIGYVAIKQVDSEVTALALKLFPTREEAVVAVRKEARDAYDEFYEQAKKLGQSEEYIEEVCEEFQVAVTDIETQDSVVFQEYFWDILPVYTETEDDEK